MADTLPGFIPRKLLPKDLLELLAFVPTRGWDAIEWAPLLGQLRRVSWQLASRRGINQLAASANALTDALLVQATSGVGLEKLGKRQKKSAGDAILRFYFAQFKNTNGLFLDLREPRFASDNGVLHFRPSGLYVMLDDDFRLGMIDLYRGFYAPDPVLLDEALHRMGFLHDALTSAKERELKGLLENNFGAQQRSQSFSISAFRESFNALFDLFIDNGCRLRSDFVLVGFYLITLYLVLESLAGQHDVKALWEREMAT
jgi:hypothetical protein